MVRVQTVNHIPATTFSFLASGIEPSRGTRGEDIEALMPHARHSAARNGLPRVVWGQSVFDAPSGSASPPSLPMLPLLLSLRSHNRGQRPLWRFTISRCVGSRARLNHPPFPLAHLPNKLYSYTFVPRSCGPCSFVGRFTGNPAGYAPSGRFGRVIESGSLTLPDGARFGQFPP